jgi:hypothetical protein
MQRRMSRIAQKNRRLREHGSANRHWVKLVNITTAGSPVDVAP